MQSLTTVSEPKTTITKAGQFARLLTSRPVLTIVAVVGLALILLDSYLVYRAIKGNPGWQANIDFAGYLATADTIAHSQDPYYVVCPCTNFYGTTQVHDQYPYPPLLAELFIPFSRIKPDLARLIWLVFSASCFVATWGLLLRGFGPKIPYAWIGLIIGIIGTAHIIRNDLYHGQVNFLLIFLLTLGLWLYVHSRPTLAGIALGITFVIKPFLGIFLLYFWWRKQWKTSLAAFLTGGGLFVTSFAGLILLSGWGVIESWLNTSSYYSFGDIAARPDNYSAHAVLLRLFNPNPFTQIWANLGGLVRIFDLVIIGLVLAFFAYCLPRSAHWFSRIRQQPAELLAESGLIVGLLLTYGPLTEHDHLLLMLPGFIGIGLITYQQIKASSPYRRSWLIALVVWSGLFIYLLAPLRIRLGLQDPTSWTPIGGTAILITGQLVIALVLVTVTLGLALRQSAAVRPEDATQS